MLMQEKTGILTIDDYISSCPEEIRPKLRELRELISRAEPEMTEKRVCFAYGSDMALRMTLGAGAGAG